MQNNARVFGGGSSPLWSQNNARAQTAWCLPVPLSLHCGCAHWQFFATCYLAAILKTLPAAASSLAPPLTPLPPSVVTWIRSAHQRRVSASHATPMNAPRTWGHLAPDPAGGHPRPRSRWLRLPRTRPRRVPRRASLPSRQARRRSRTKGTRKAFFGPTSAWRERVNTARQTPMVAGAAPPALRR